MIFKRAVQRYGQSPQPETPYQRAGQLWDERIGTARVQARNWRTMAFGGLLLSTTMAMALIWQSLQSRVTPFVVEVDRLGEARAVTEAEAAFSPSDPQIAWHLSKFIRNIRSLSLDPVVMREDWLSAYDFATKRGARFIGEYARTSNPFANVGARTVSVQVTSVVRASESSFQIKWRETTYENGAEANLSHWTAMVTVRVRPPVSAEILRKNPLGLYVDAIDWSRELEAPATAKPPSPPPAPLPVSIETPRDPAADAIPSSTPQTQEIRS